MTTKIFSCSFLFIRDIEKQLFCKLKKKSYLNSSRVKWNLERATLNLGLKLRMCKLKKVLAIILIALSLINFAEICYFGYVICENYHELALFNLLITVFINFAGIFFIVVLIVGIAQSNDALLKTWMIYALLELMRSSIIFYDTWTDPKDDNFEKIFNSCDTILQVLMILTVFEYLQVIRIQKDSEKKISTIERSLAMHEKPNVKK